MTMNPARLHLDAEYAAREGVHSVNADHIGELDLLEEHAARMDREARLVCLHDNDVKAIVNTGAIACFRLPGIVGIVQRLALVLLGKVNNRRRPTHCGSTAASEKIVAGGRLT